MHGFTHLLTRFDGHGAVRRFAEVPASCPSCAHYADVRRLSAHSITPGDGAVEFVFQCPRADCRRVFVGEYRRAADGEYELLHTLPLATPVEARMAAV